jgi:exodeoxyribonuclease-5
MTTTLTLTSSQQAAVDGALAVLRRGHGVYKIGGFAGTGKTVLARSIFDEIPGGLPCSLTGKAACRLRQKGIAEARTIHKTIYNVEPYSWRCTRKHASELNGCWFLIDEASMVSEKIWRDICSYEMPIILIGDPGQLEPIGGDPELMHHPDVTLTEIHRQAADNGIIQFATDTRRGAGWKDAYPDVTLLRGGKLDPQDMLDADILLCGFNNTRIKCNRRMRSLLGHPKDDLIVPGEKIIVLRNNYVHEIFNGQILTVSEILTQDLMTVTVKATDEEGSTLDLPLIREQFSYPGLLELDSEEVEREWVYSDYGYCVTTHKAQGSEWDKVIVMNQIAGSWEARRWQYTAITRAAEKLMYWIN